MTAPPPPPPARTVADTYLALLKSRGIDHLFANAGTDFAPLIEAFAKAGESGAAVPEPMLVPHENVAVGMAYGYAMVTGRMQAVMVHVGVGTANAVCGLFNAYKQSIPILFTAGRTPWTEGGVPGGRNNYINWAQEMFDQAGMVREATKWDYELRHPAHLEAVVDRALSIARSEPAGPVYLVLPREVLAAAHDGACRPAATQSPTRLGHPGPEAIAEVGRLLYDARRPMLITADAGRDALAWRALAAFAERHAVPVVQYRPRVANLPDDHPMHAGYDPAGGLRDADLVLVLDCDVPWIPDVAGPRADATVVQLGSDPLCASYPLRGFRSDLSIAANTAAILTALAEQTPADGLGARREWAQGLRQHVEPAGPEGGMTSAWVSRCIGEASDADTVLLNEYSLVLEQLRLDRHGAYFAHSPAGGLGWAMGAALGVKLARPHAVPIACVGDGTYMFGNPTPFHFVSRARSLPVVTVIFNNRRWGAVHRATLAMYGDGHAARSSEPALSVLEPAPEYHRIVEASGGYGEKVVEPQELPAALRRAIDAVRVRGLPAVLNVITEISYSRSS